MRLLNRQFPIGQFAIVLVVSTLGVLVEINCESDFVSRGEEFQQLVKDVAMHIAATDPRWVNRTEVPEADLDKEREIVREMLMADPKNSGKPVFDLNADGLIFWDTKNPDYAEGQKITAKVAMGQEFAKSFTQINGSLPVRSDIDLSDAAYQDCQRDAAKNLSGAIAANQVVMSLGHNMAQTSAVTASLRDVITEFLHNDSITPELAQKRLADAADSAR